MNSTMRFCRVLNFLVDGCAMLAALILIFVWASICLNVAMRYLMHKPQVWVIELCEYSILYMTFLGAAWLHKKKGHVSVDWMVALLPPKYTELLNLMTSYIGAALFLLITWYGVETTWSHYVRGTYRITLLETPMYLILGIIPIGSFLLALEFLFSSQEHLRQWRALRRE